MLQQNIRSDVGTETQSDGGLRSPESVPAPFERSKESLRLSLYASLMALDLLCIFGAFVLVALVRSNFESSAQGLHMVAVLVPTFLGIALNNRAYSKDSLERPAAGWARACGALLISAIGVITLFFVLKISSDFSRLVLLFGTGVALVLMVVSRGFVGRKLGEHHQWTFINRLVLVDGAQVAAAPGDLIVYADAAGIEANEHDPMMLDRIGRMIERCDRVVVACEPERRAHWARMLKSTAVDVEMLMPELTDMGALELRPFNEDMTLVVSYGPLCLRDRSLKRFLDLLVAGSAIIMLAPLLALVALAIKLDSPGPVLFGQNRVGKDNRFFKILKFRSMCADRADTTGIRSTSREDDRITRVGRFLRRTSIDELPQLFNVLLGDMSIVGPRPHALGSTAEESLFWQIDSRYFHRHAIKPGLTGLAQVRGFRGATSTRLDLTNRLQSDLEYLAGWTVWRDVKIIFRTFAVLFHSNAY